MQSIRASCSRNFLTVSVGDKGIPDGLDLNERDPNLWFDKTISRARTKKQRFWDMWFIQKYSCNNSKATNTHWIFWKKKRKITASRSPTARPGRCILELFRVGVLVTIDSGGFFLHGCTLNNALSRKNYQKLTYVLNSKRNSETHGLDPQPHRTRVGSMRWKSPPDVAAKRLKTSCR